MPATQFSSTLLTLSEIVALGQLTRISPGVRAGREGDLSSVETCVNSSKRRVESPCASRDATSSRRSLSSPHAAASTRIDPLDAAQGPIGKLTRCGASFRGPSCEVLFLDDTSALRNDSSGPLRVVRTKLDQGDLGLEALRGSGADHVPQRSAAPLPTGKSRPPSKAENKRSATDYPSEHHLQGHRSTR